MRRRTLLAAAIISGCAIEMGCSGTGAASGGSGFSEGASELQAAAIKKLEVATGNAWSVSYDAFLGTAYHAAGSTAPLLNGGVTATQATLSFLAENKEAALRAVIASPGRMMINPGIARRLARCSMGWWVGPSSPTPIESCVKT